MIDWGFIATLEGKGVLKGYVPIDRKTNTVFGQSGVTVSTGLDLANYGADALKALGLSKALLNKLLPYTPYKKLAAVEFLKKNPLVITKEENQEIEEKLHKKFEKDIEMMYNAHSSVKFKAIPDSAQTVIASVGYQYGNMPKRTPNFWKSVTTQNWAKAIEQLNNFGDAYGNRRRKEAKYLQERVLVR